MYINQLTTFLKKSSNYRLPSLTLHPSFALGRLTPLVWPFNARSRTYMLIHTTMYFIFFWKSTAPKFVPFHPTLVSCKDSVPLWIYRYGKMTTHKKFVLRCPPNILFSLFFPLTLSPQDAPSAILSSYLWHTLPTRKMRLVLSAYPLPSCILYNNHLCSCTLRRTIAIPTYKVPIPNELTLA